ncbi:MAG: type I-B CRISPR-associated protein Cas7/Csh2 [Bacillota bacterium]|nr:type I-B CRISPR-associated protein Cas7/Csh2 [Bacillota bacterium]
MIKNRSELVFLYDIVDNNPNGNPLDSNKPRIDEESGINIVTEVRLKRTIRDYLNEYKGKEIFVREIRDEDDKVQDAKARARDFGSTKIDIAKKVLEECIDVRLFGATIPLELEKKSKTKKNDNVTGEDNEKDKDKKEKSSITFTGPVQFNMGRSLHRVELKRIKGTGAFASDSGKDNKTFREEYILPYSLIGFYGIINEHAAEKTNLSQEDIDLLIDAMWNGTKNLISRSKVGQLPRILIKVNYKEDNYHIGGLLNKIRLDSKIDDEAIRGTKDYIVNLDDFIDVIYRNKDKIENIEYSIDEDIKVSYKGQTKQIKNLIEGISLKKLNL